MNAGDWITLSAIIVALGIGVASVLHTQNMQKKERKERLLNEIIEWAENTYKCGVESNYWNLNNIVSKYFDKPHDKKSLLAELSLYNFTGSIELSSAYVIVERESNYIITISSIFGISMQNSVKRLQESLKEHINLIDKWQRVFVGLDKIKKEQNKEEVLAHIDEMIKNNKNQIHLFACDVIETASEIKTENIN